MTSVSFAILVGSMIIVRLPMNAFAVDVSPAVADSVSTTSAFSDTTWSPLPTFRRTQLNAYADFVFWNHC